MSTNILSSLFAQKSWTNRELFETLAHVSEVDHTVARNTAIRTLNHIYVVDQIFKGHLLNEPHGYSATNTEETPSLDELHFAVSQTDLWFEQYSANISEDALSERIQFQFTDGDFGTMTRQEMLFHVITHGAYHRGNVGQVLKGISVAPPRDLFTKFLHVSQPQRRIRQ
jgi:uncharacterized damage-inducible protein DinB